MSQEIQIELTVVTSSLTTLRDMRDIDPDTMDTNIHKLRSIAGAYNETLDCEKLLSEIYDSKAVVSNPENISSTPTGTFTISAATQSSLAASESHSAEIIDHKYDPFIFINRAS